MPTSEWIRKSKARSTVSTAHRDDKQGPREERRGVSGSGSRNDDRIGRWRNSQANVGDPGRLPSPARSEARSLPSVTHLDSISQVGSDMASDFSRPHEKKLVVYCEPIAEEEGSYYSDARSTLTEKRPKSEISHASGRD